MKLVRSVCPVSGKPISLRLESLAEAATRAALRPRNFTPEFTEALREAAKERRKRL